MFFGLQDNVRQMFRITKLDRLFRITADMVSAERQLEKAGNNYPTPDGTCIRDYIHVSDLAQAHLLALKALLSGKNSRIYNLGNSNGPSVQAVIEMARKVTGQQISAAESGPGPGDPDILIADSAKIRKELGWKPKFEDLETMIQPAWDWHKFDSASGNYINSPFK